MSQGEFNPYGAPNAVVEPHTVVENRAEDRVWRDGKDVVARIDQAFPARCIKCNAPVNTPLKKRTFYWHTPWLYVLILINLILYALVALFVRKKSTHAVALCPQHAKRRTMFVLIGVSSLIIPPALGMLIGGDAGLVIGIGGFVVMLLVGVFGARILIPRRIDETHARYRGACEAFLASLSRFPGALRR